MNALGSIVTLAFFAVPFYVLCWLISVSRQKIREEKRREAARKLRGVQLQ